MIPKQEYELVSVSKLGTENETALTCEDCGRTIFNFAVIKGKQDGKEYTVGLTCVKKLLKIRQVEFSSEDEWKMQAEEMLFDEAARTKKWLAKTLEKCKAYKPFLKYVDYKGEFYVEIRSGIDSGSLQKGFYLARTKFLQERFKVFFKDFNVA